MRIERREEEADGRGERTEHGFDYDARSWPKSGAHRE
jgi:hypothetical protein